MNTIYGWLVVAGFWVLPIYIVTLIVAALSKGERRATCGYILLNISYLWGFGLWLGCAISVKLLWGWFGLIVGLAIGGVGVVPLAILAESFNSYWSDAGNNLLAVTVVFAARFVAMKFIQAREEPTFLAADAERVTNE